eukprot:TRINITY_DN3430_c0_g1_i1.p2 TRINITY_DN3430_c0_g1~~TRINITY_DN3430_c0_g1_i1.p2  ORF type:complete len:253 (-),score=36.42 TRINITY_DN3430_c0_g1_i1:691-1449(-)
MKDNPNFTDEQIFSIFGNLQGIYTFHQLLLHQLQIGTHKEKTVTELFCQLESLIRSHKDFIKHFDEGSIFLLQMKRSSSLSRIVEDPQIDECFRGFVGLLCARLVPIHQTLRLRSQLQTWLQQVTVTALERAQLSKISVELENLSKTTSKLRLQEVSGSIITDTPHLRESVRFGQEKFHLWCKTTTFVSGGSCDYCLSRFQSLLREINICQICGITCHLECYSLVPFNCGKETQEAISRLNKPSREYVREGK